MSLKDLKETASVLNDIPISDMFASMASAIADAQKKLDDNSVQQAILLANPDNGVNGKSLLELGFTPAFYHFQSADISASISLKVMLSTESEFKIDAKASYTNQSGYTDERYDFLKKSKNTSSYKEFRSSNRIVLKASETESFKVEETT